MQLIKLSILSLFGLVSAAPTTGSTVVKIVNNCRKTIQLGQLSNEQQPPLPIPIRSGKSKSYTFHGTWSGRFWARQDCTGSECQIAGAAFPASLAEFTFRAAGGNDFYDLSFVDGYNLPVSVTPVNPTEDGTSKYWCGAPTCDIAPVCPPELQLRENGVYIGCQSACSKFGNPEYCCAGAFGTPDKCPMNRYARVIKNACPDAYSFAYDDQESLYQCSAPAYIVTWCPN